MKGLRDIFSRWVTTALVLIATGCSSSDTTAVQASPISSNSFPNEPAGFVATGGAMLSDGALSWGMVVRAGSWSIQEDPAAPVAPPYLFRAHYPGGMQGGHEAAVPFTAVNRTTPGFYLSYAFRLSGNWQQGASEMNGVKHVIPFITQPGQQSTFWGWTSWVNHPEDGYRISVTLDGWNGPRRDIPYINTEARQAARFSRGQWVHLEMLVDFNTAGANSGRVQVWVNGVRTHDAPEDMPAVSVDELQIAGTFGGGIGNVPHDQWYDIDHIRISIPGN